MIGSPFSVIKARVDRGLNRERAWTEQDIEAAINMAYVNLAEYSGVFEAEKTLQLVSDTTYYDLETDLDLTYVNADTEPIPVAGLVPLRIWNPTTAIWLDITTVSELDRNYPRWGASGGSPQKWFMRGASVMGIYPKPLVAAATDTLVLRYSAVPSYLTYDAQYTCIPRQYEGALESGARFYLKGLEREPKAAVAAWKEFVETREQLKDYVQQRMSRAYIPTMGGSQIGARR